MQPTLAAIPIFLLVMMPVLMVWEAVWKGIGLWKSGRNNQLIWFIFIFIFNTMGILPIVYLAFFQRKADKAREKPPAKPVKKKRKK
ncbi:MAG TPA: hypothetical protein ENN46_03225 [Candidatus Woesearchaeota archaeon]|nr:hypothetical protein [Candidatus Woesearchaeota archaeon]